MALLPCRVLFYYLVGYFYCAVHCYHLGHILGICLALLLLRALSILCFCLRGADFVALFLGDNYSSETIISEVQYFEAQCNTAGREIGPNGGAASTEFGAAGWGAFFSRG